MAEISITGPNLKKGDRVSTEIDVKYFWLAFSGI